jgi:small membrane protein
MLYFQLLASLFILFAMQRIVARFHEARIPRSEVLVWVIFWLIVAGAVWWPEGTDIIANFLGISRGYELVVASSLAVLFYVVFKLFSHVHQLQSDLTKLVRELAIQQHQEPVKPEHQEHGSNN